MADVLAAVGLVAGAAFVFVAAVGVLRMPDLYTRMHAAAKAGALGAGLTVVSAAVAVGGASLAVRALVTLVFIVLTAPVAAHALARAYHRGSR